MHKPMVVFATSLRVRSYSLAEAESENWTSQPIIFYKPRVSRSFEQILLLEGFRMYLLLDLRNIDTALLSEAVKRTRIISEERCSGTKNAYFLSRKRGCFGTKDAHFFGSILTCLPLYVGLSSDLLDCDLFWRV